MNLAMTVPASFGHENFLKSVRILSKNSKNYRYSRNNQNLSFGQATQQVSNILEFKKKKEIKTNSQKSRASYYNPSTGRFVSEDPIGFAGEDSNLFRYVENNPAKYVDPHGLRSRSEIWFKNEVERIRKEIFSINLDIIATQKLIDFKRKCGFDTSSLENTLKSLRSRRTALKESEKTSRAELAKATAYADSICNNKGKNRRDLDFGKTTKCEALLGGPYAK
ncbi:MAG: RHS repeat-associated core domain-containing protein [Oligoflexia bacterium]|nr:RHS repeat-associated core domain-containing protein [Oligoflexia bacterium]